MEAARRILPRCDRDGIMVAVTRISLQSISTVLVAAILVAACAKTAWAQESPQVLGVGTPAGRPGPTTRSGDDLIQAIHFDDVKRARAALDAAADVNSVDQAGDSALFRAIDDAQDATLVRLLLEHKANLAGADRDGLTALEAATLWDGSPPQITAELLRAGAVVRPGAKRAEQVIVSAAKSNVENLQLLLDAGANMDSVVEPGDTPLTLAARYDRKWQTRLLISRGASVNLANADMQTPLLIAAMYDFRDLLDFLVGAGRADVRTADRRGATALDYFAMAHDSRAVQTLLDNGADPSATDINGHDAMWHSMNGARNRSNEPETSALLRQWVQGGGHKAPATTRGRVDLFRAIYLGNLDDARADLDAGTSANATDSDGRSPLERAIETQDARFVSLLIDHGADAKRSGVSGNSPIWAAVSADECIPGIVSLLLRANPAVKNEWHGTRNLLIQSCESSSLANTQALIDGGADVNAGSGRMTALHAAARRGSMVHTRLLISRGADVDALDSDGKSPLMLAAERDSASVVEFLVVGGHANVKFADSAGRTPLDLFAQSHDLKAVQILLDAGADPKATDKAGHDAVWYSQTGLENRSDEPATSDLLRQSSAGT